MIKDYFKSLQAGFKSFSIFLGILAVVLAFIFWKVDYTTTVEIFWPVSIITLLFCLLYIFIAVSINNFNYMNEQLKNIPQLPKIININKPNNRSLLLYTTTSVFFSKGIEVSFCILDEIGAESVFCYGQVVHVQEKLIQIEISAENNDFTDLNQLYNEMIKYNTNMYLVKPGKVII